jgi:alkylhydroperoxidase family enzyme
LNARPHRFDEAGRHQRGADSGYGVLQRSPLFDPKDKTTLLYAERMTRGASAIREGTLEELKQYYSEPQIVELTLTICIANFTNRYNDALQLQPDLG